MLSNKLDSLQIHRLRRARTPGSAMNRNEIHARLLHRAHEIHCLAQILVDPNLHGHGLVRVGGRGKGIEGGFRRCDERGDERAFVHESRAEGLSACPGLRTAAVDVDAVYEGGEERGGAGYFEGTVDAELGDCWGGGGGEGEIWG